MEIKDIKFKAKRLDNGEWVEGSLVKSYLNSKYQTYIIPIFNRAGDIKTILVIFLFLYILCIFVT